MAVHPFIPLPNGIQLSFDFTTAGQLWQNNFNVVKNAGGVTATDLATVAGLGTAWFQASMINNLTQETTLRQCRATDITMKGGEQAVSTSGFTGTVATKALANNSALVLSLRTARRGRSYRGRIYLTGAPEASQVNGVSMQTAYTNAVGTAFNTLWTNLTNAGFKLVVQSKAQNGQPLVTAIGTAVTQMIMDAFLDSMRRRLAGRGK